MMECRTRACDPGFAVSAFQATEGNGLLGDGRVNRKWRAFLATFQAAVVDGIEDPGLGPGLCCVGLSGHGGVGD
jgi:hypothetical protein